MDDWVTAGPKIVRNALNLEKRTKERKKDRKTERRKELRKSWMIGKRKEKERKTEKKKELRKMWMIGSVNHLFLYSVKTAYKEVD